MKWRHILFSAPMVRALLEGRKTQTRRIAARRLQSSTMVSSPFEVMNLLKEETVGDFWYFDEEACKCPYGVVGDRLWVREAHWMDRRDQSLAVMAVDGFVVAKNGIETGNIIDVASLRQNRFWKLLPSIYMPRWASRITLEIADIRIERLNDISEEDAHSEGVLQVASDFCCAHFRELWEKINGKGSWDLNPWVWVIEFRRVQL